MAPTASFVTNIGSFAGFAQGTGPYALQMGMYFIHYVIMSDFFLGRITPPIMMYMGVVMGVIAELIAAAYILVKTTDAVISFTKGFAFNYRRDNILGNLMGQLETLYVTIFFASGFGLAVVTLLGGAQIWEALKAREEGVTKGFLGQAVSYTQAIKFFTLGTAVVVPTYFAAYGIGQTVDQLIGWFDQWQDHKGKEPVDKVTAAADIAGTSLS